MRSRDDGCVPKRPSSASAFVPPSRPSTRRRARFRATKSPSSRRKEDLQGALDDILPEAFAVCREGGKRVLNMRHFDVQLIGGIVCTTARSPR